MIRLTLDEGGDGTFMVITMLNDTGSDVMPMFDTDLPKLDDLTNYIGGGGVGGVANTNGNVDLLA